MLFECVAVRSRRRAASPGSDRIGVSQVREAVQSTDGPDNDGRPIAAGDLETLALWFDSSVSK
jgi:hypothetical protein